MTNRNEDNLGWNHAVNRPKTKGEARADAVVAAVKLAILGAVGLAMLVAFFS